MQEEAVRRVRPNGVYFEQTLYYALDFLLHARLQASRDGIDVPSDFDQILSKMLAFVQAVSQVGPPDGFGDDDGGRVFDFARNHANHMTNPFALGAALFQEEGLRYRGTVTEEAIWLFGETAVSVAAERPESSLPAKSQAFPDGGIYVLANSEVLPQQAATDAGPQGTGHCGHGHADALSMRLSFGESSMAGRRGDLRLHRTGKRPGHLPRNACA